MKQLLKYLNFAGILLLALLCAAQWKTNSQLAAALIQLQEKSDNQAVTISKQNDKLTENAADLDDFRQRLTLSESQLKNSETDLLKTQQERDQLAAEQVKLLAAIDQRMQVIKEQTDVLTKQVQSIHTLEDQRNQAIGNFNELVAKYNALVSPPK